MDLTTPALLFPAISLLLLAYTNRFLVLAQLIRQLHGQNRDQVEPMVIRQIHNLNKRLTLIRTMQVLGVLSFVCCTLTMFLLFIDLETAARLAFGLSLALLVASLLCSLYEIGISTNAIQIELEDLESRAS
ncbi:MAG: DUF2721 domain-containing protein [Candidatus Latescibacteria bacterium]|nr:DUF2721 domain-containing protein [Candidatus Latescibacterota bacterium]